MDGVPWRTAAAIAAITGVVFSGTLGADFVYDARMQILTDPFLHDPANWFDVLTFRVLARDVLDFNRPVHLASLMLDAAAWGRNPFGYHLTSVLLHAANAVLLWLVIRALLTGRGRLPPPAAPGSAQRLPGGREEPPRPPADGDPRSFAAGIAAAEAALIFALHPVVVEAVCEPTFREDLLVATFTLAALLIAQGHAAATAGVDPVRAAACTGACLLAIGSKETGIAAPGLLAAWWWLFRRGEPGGFWAAVILAAKLVVLGFLAARFLLEPATSVVFETKPGHPGGSLAAALQIQPRILALYAQIVLVPVNLCAAYDGASISHLPTWAAVAVLTALVLAAGFAIRHDRRLAFAAAAIVLPILPVSNVVPIYHPAADRYLYLPMAGVGMAAACLLDAPWWKPAAAAGRSGRDVAAMVGLATIVALAPACVARQRVWSGSVALWQDTVGKNPTSSLAATGLAEALLEAGRLTEAEASIRRAILLAGEARGDQFATLALVLDGQGRAGEAAEALRHALAADPRLADPSARVTALAMERPTAEALDDLVRRVRGAGDVPPR